jgi:hypothetical protein
MRLDFTPVREVHASEMASSRIVVHLDQIYTLDVTGKALHKYVQNEAGAILADEPEWIWDFPADEVAPDSRALDIEWVDAANGRLTPAVLVLGSEGSMFEIRSDGSARQVAVADTSTWQSPQRLATYQGNLYVLDVGRESILKYIPDGDDYQHPPTDYIREAVDINWSNVIDIAIDGLVYLLLSDSTIVKFAGGQSQPFLVEGLDPVWTSAQSMFASPQSQSLFVADEEEGRVVELSKDGQVVRQYRAEFGGQDPLGELECVTVDPVAGRILVGGPSGVSAASLPSVGSVEGQPWDS